MNKLPVPALVGLVYEDPIGMLPGIHSDSKGACMAAATVAADTAAALKASQDEEMNRKTEEAKKVVALPLPAEAPAKLIRLVIRRAPDPNLSVTNAWTIAEIAARASPPGWRQLFTVDAAPEVELVSELMDTDTKENGHFLPNKQDMFNAFRYTPLDETRVVIIGQDPYHTVRDNVPIAHGLSFSVTPGTTVPPSLKNIFKELVADCPETKLSGSGCLVPWAKQGVLMINSCLTVHAGAPGIHCKKVAPWMPFISKVLAAIAKARPNCIYVMWGSDAQKLERYLGDKSIKLKCAHPSPMSADRGFFGCKHFSRINQLLASDPRGPINWSV